MHQTFYIDLEEEISSVIDRLNKSMSADNYFVVPKRAIFLQSIVNLKLLKREAEKVGKQVVIVTQDEIGASMAQRSGLEVRSSLDGVESIIDEETEVEADDVIYHEAPVAPVNVEQKKQSRLSVVGSSDFYAPAMDLSHNNLSVKLQANKTHASLNGVVRKKSVGTHGETVAAHLGKFAPPKMTASHKRQMDAGLGYEKNLNVDKEKALEKMYSSSGDISKKHSSAVSDNEGKIKKIFLGFIGLCGLAFVGVAVYLFLPSAKIIIEPNILKNKIDLDVHGGSDIAAVNQKNIPIRVIDKEETITLSYEVVGGLASGGKKSHGSVVIYNEYDSSPQTLIATTRLESASGKIFRLVKNVVVPGMTTVAGELKPGAIVAEIIADQPGSEYNLDSTTFTIPGFKDGPKYGKFSAKSTESIVGGSSDGETAGGAVTQRDIDSAKQKTETALDEKIGQLIKNELSDRDVDLAEAEKITITKSVANAKVGDMVSTFNYTVAASVRALVFSENDVKKIVDQAINEQKALDVKKDISKIEYGTVDGDFEKNTLDLKVYSEIISTPIIDKQQIKDELLGKTDDQLASILKKYTSIKSVNIEFHPTFVSRIPEYAQRVTLEIKNEAN